MWGDTIVPSEPSRTSRFVRRWRIVDWVLCCVLIFGCEALAKWGPVHCKGFYWDDPSINYPMRPNTFPTWSLVPISVAPVLVYAGVAVMTPTSPPGTSPHHEVASLALMQARSIALNTLMTEPAKLYEGELRPDFLARLRRAGYLPPTNVSTFEHLCDVTAPEVREGRKSFPSGHSSTAFAAMVPLALFLVRRMGTFGRHHGSLARLLVGALPMALAFAVAISRNRDEWHRVVDVVGGSVIGAAAGCVAYWLSMEPAPAGHHTDADDVPRAPETPRRTAPGSSTVFD